MNTIPIRYVTGDATCPTEVGPQIIAHVCNDIGGWGAGFVLALSKRWKAPEKAFRRWYRGEETDCAPFGLGAVQFVPVTDQIVVANMVGQHGIRGRSNLPPVRYEAIAQALETLGSVAIKRGASVHMPRIGCGLAGGTWDRIEPLIMTHLADRGVQVTVYDFGPS